MYVLSVQYRSYKGLTLCYFLAFEPLRALEFNIVLIMD